jgi:hypothetical protein
MNLLCEGCSHAKHQEEGFCYMFEQQPEELPCGQHDKFKEVRRATGELIRKHPLILAGMIGGYR